MTKLLIDESPLQVCPTLAIYFGLNEALILQQLNYWFGKDPPMGRIDDDEVRWIRMTLPEWCKNFPFFDEGQIRRALSNLLKDGVLLRRQFTGRSFWYRIDRDFIDALNGPVKRIAALQQKRQEAADKALDKRISEQSVQTQENDECICTECSGASEQSVQIICTKCSASKTTSKTTSKTPLSNESGSSEPRSPPKAKKKPKKPHSPAFKKYTEVTGYYGVVQNWRDKMTAAVGDKPEDLEFWGKVVEAWTGLGWFAGNVQGQLEYFERHELPGASRNGRKPNKTHQRGDRAKQPVARASGPGPPCTPDEG